MGVVVRVYWPSDDMALRPGVLFFHGGGWVIGDLDTHDVACRQITAEAGVGREAVVKDYEAAFGRETAERLIRYPLINAGVFALQAGAPHWRGCWERSLPPLTRSSSTR